MPLTQDEKYAALVRPWEVLFGSASPHVNAHAAYKQALERKAQVDQNESLERIMFPHLNLESEEVSDLSPFYKYRDIQHVKETYDKYGLGECDNTKAEASMRANALLCEQEKFPPPNDQVFYGVWKSCYSAWKKDADAAGLKEGDPVPDDVMERRHQCRLEAEKAVRTECGGLLSRCLEAMTPEQFREVLPKKKLEGDCRLYADCVSYLADIRNGEALKKNRALVEDVLAVAPLEAPAPAPKLPDFTNYSDTAKPPTKFQPPQSA